MNQSEFRHFAEAYGAEIARWPDAVQADAEALSRMPWARAILDEVAETDALFAELSPDVAPGRVGASIAAVNRRIQAPRFDWRRLFRRFALQGAGVATAGVLGIFLAVATSPPAVSDSEAISQLFALTLSFSDSALLTSFGDQS